MPRFDTLNSAWMVWDGPAPAPEVAVLEYTRELEKFLAEIERRAFRMAQVALRDADDALDVVQDAMLKLARNYASRPSAEWRPLFYRILENGIRDLQRRRSVRKRFMTWLPGPKEDPDNEAQDPLDNVADSAPAIPESADAGTGHAASSKSRCRHCRRGSARHSCCAISKARMLPRTATAMGCSEGSVKTHYSRAVHTLRDQLGEVW